jgi:hypothetical protein
MLPKCELVRQLEEIERDSAPKGAVGLGLVARSALNIIADANENSLRQGDIECLADLIFEFANEGHGDLLTYLREDTTDCPICAALAKHIGKGVGY